MHRSPGSLFALAAVALGLALAAAAGSGCSKSQSSAGALKVAAAASLSEAYAELGEAFTKKTGRKVIITPSASGKLARQVIEGAPFDVFAAADEKWVDQAIAKGGAVAETKRLYAFGRLVAWSKDHPVETLADLGGDSIKKIAIANPETAPYGRAARQALGAAGLWKSLESRILYAGNVRQSLQYAESGNAEVALTALSLVINSGEGTYTLIDGKLHGPLAQAIVATKRGDRAAADEFIAFVDSDAGHAILKRYGLLQKGETLAGR